MSVTETGEQELFDAELDPTEPDVAEVEPTSSSAARIRRQRTRRRLDRASLAARWEGLDAKRAIVLALVVSVVALTLAMPVRTYFSQRAEFDQLRASNDRLRTEVTDYQQKVNEQGDPAYIEAKARERLQFVRPGEKALVMMFPGDDARAAAQKQAEQRARNPWYGNLWESVSTPPGTK
ncbi:septum formation initiator family protein [Gordonia insulae]|uniref:Cell division protein FtsL n=1 Tax=Gordonia insulae TaxID=2420509 RepID=A0A3G8JKX6_9ACTN|nr:septum formation initiator family protein [Gordonia insulae]AZG45089.1 Cell division protein FtsL [Gordonia insulae]